MGEVLNGWGRGGRGWIENGLMVRLLRPNLGPCSFLSLISEELFTLSDSWSSSYFDPKSGVGGGGTNQLQDSRVCAGRAWQNTVKAKSSGALDFCSSSKGIKAVVKAAVSAISWHRFAEPSLMLMLSSERQANKDDGCGEWFLHVYPSFTL